MARGLAGADKGLVACSMPRWQVAYLTACTAIVGGTLAYLLCDFGQWPRLLYEPYSRSWLFSAKAPTAATMHYLGMLLWGLSGAICSSALTLVVCKRSGRTLSDRTMQLIGAWSLTLVGFCGLYFLWGLWPF